jgi:nitrogen fixation protein FixH
MTDASTSSSQGFRVTGRFVLVCLIGFFILVASINGVMLRLALKTFPGVDAENAYKAGLAFNAQIAAAEEQVRRNWHVDVSVSSPGSRVQLDIRVKPGEGKLPGQLELKGKLAHPAVRSRDIVLEANDQQSPGRFVVPLDVETGQWQLEFTIGERGVVMFRSTNRLFIP